jgi:hypothetical protein
MGMTKPVAASAIKGEVPGQASTSIKTGWRWKWRAR